MRVRDVDYFTIYSAFSIDDEWPIIYLSFALLFLRLV